MTKNPSAVNLNQGFRPMNHNPDCRKCQATVIDALSGQSCIGNRTQSTERNEIQNQSWIPLEMGIINVTSDSLLVLTVVIDDYLRFIVNHDDQSRRQSSTKCDTPDLAAL
jgi:hypothetical protein